VIQPKIWLRGSIFCWPCFIVVQLNLSTDFQWTKMPHISVCLQNTVNSVKYISYITVFNMLSILNLSLQVFCGQNIAVLSLQ